MTKEARVGTLVLAALVIAGGRDLSARTPGARVGAQGELHAALRAHERTPEGRAREPVGPPDRLGRPPPLRDRSGRDAHRGRRRGRRRRRVTHPDRHARDDPDPRAPRRQVHRARARHRARRRRDPGRRVIPSVDPTDYEAHHRPERRHPRERPRDDVGAEGRPADDPARRRPAGRDGAEQGVRQDHDGRPAADAGQLPPDERVARSRCCTASTRARAWSARCCATRSSPRASSARSRTSTA